MLCSSCFCCLTFDTEYFLVEIIICLSVISAWFIPNPISACMSSPVSFLDWWWWGWGPWIMNRKIWRTDGSNSVLVKPDLLQIYQGIIIVIIIIIIVVTSYHHPYRYACVSEPLNKNPSSSTNQIFNAKCQTILCGGLTPIHTLT